MKPQEKLTVMLLLISALLGAATFASAAPPNGKKKSTISRAYSKMKKVLGFRKSPQAVSQSYASVRSRRSSSASGQSRSSVSTSSGPAVKTTLVAEPRQQSLSVNSANASQRPTALSQLPGAHAAARQQHQYIMQNANIRHPAAARPAAQGAISGRAPRPLPVVPLNASRVPPSKPPVIGRSSPGFGFQNGQKVVHPTGQGHGSVSAVKPSGYMPAPNQGYSNVSNVPQKTINQYQSANSPL